MSPLEARQTVLCTIRCDNCTDGPLKAPTAFGDEDGWPHEWEDVEELRKAAKYAGWTHEGEGAEERWHCPDCPEFGKPPAAGPGQEALPL